VYNPGVAKLITNTSEPDVHISQSPGKELLLPNEPEVTLPADGPVNCQYKLLVESQVAAQGLPDGVYTLPSNEVFVNVMGVFVQTGEDAIVKDDIGA
jgi:hypothetical protein